MRALNPRGKIRVLVVDDAPLIRTLLAKTLSSDPMIEVVGTACDAFDARERLVELNPDVMTLDIEMPKMAGLTFLEAVMKHKPVKTLVISSLTEKNSRAALRAMELGAVDVIPKPVLKGESALAAFRAELVERVKAVALPQALPNLAARAQALKKISSSEGGHKNQSAAKAPPVIVAIASSTGGTEALKKVLPKLPKESPPILIAQHMPPVFTKTYAQAMARMCQVDVREAVDGERILPGVCLIAPGDYHMEVSRSGTNYYVKLHQEPLLHNVRPAADYLMRSVAKLFGARATGVILTGMGRDGAAGLLAMRQAGATTIAQDEASSVVFGMPKEAIELKAVDRVLSLEAIAGDLMAQFKRPSPGS